MLFTTLVLFILMEFYQEGTQLENWLLLSNLIIAHRFAALSSLESRVSAASQTLAMGHLLRLGHLTTAHLLHISYLRQAFYSIVLSGEWDAS